MDKIKLKGIYKCEHFDASGNLKKSWHVNNSVVTVGKAELANLTGNVSSPAYFTYLAVGTSSTAVSAGQTALQSEITDSGLERASATVSRTTTTTTNDTLSLIHTWTATGSKTIEEVGVFNDASAGIMLSRALTTSAVMATSETFKITYTLTFA